MGSAVGAEEELGVARGCGPEKGVAVRRGLRDGLAEAEWVSGPVVDDDGEVVRGDAAESESGDIVARRFEWRNKRCSNSRTTFLDGFDGGSGSAMLQDDAKLGEALVQLEQGGKETFLGRQDGHVTLRRHFTVKVEDHVLTLHFGEHGVELGVVDDARGGVGGHARGVALDAGDALLLRFDDGLRGHRLVEVEGHEVVDIGFNGF